MKIKVSKDTKTVKEIRRLLKENDGYCPCRLVKNEDTKCPCKEFREQAEPGECCCGLYVKEREYDVWDIESKSYIPTDTYIVQERI